MKIPDSVKTRLRTNRWLVGGGSAALLFFTAAYYFVLRSRDLDPSLVNNQILLFTLRNINVLLVITILFVLLRNLFKLWVERRSRILGSKFKTKLVATYIGLTLIPVLLLFAYATELMQGSIENLFSTPTEELLEPGNDVSQALTSFIQTDNRRVAYRVLGAIQGIDLDNPQQRPRLDRNLQRLLKAEDIDILAVYADTDFVHAVVDPRAPLTNQVDPGRGFLLEIIRNGAATRVEELASQPERLLLGGAARPGQDGLPSTVVVTGRVLREDLANATSALVSAYQTRRQQEVLEPEIKTVYLLVFLMVTLVILLTSSWMGLYLARRVTVPIQALADGTRHVMSGDLQYRVEAAADDELGVLVDSFNRMTTEIDKSRQQLLLSNQELSEERTLISTILENVAAGIISIDAEGTVLTCNSAALEMLDLPETALLQRNLREVWRNERSELLELFDEELHYTGRARKEISLNIAGERKTFEATTTEMLDKEGKVSGLVIVLEDLTELIEAQKLATWTEAARRIAHEIKNPLTPIKLSAERLLMKYRKQDAALGEAIEDAAAVIGKEVASMKAMVDEFARFARMPPTQMRSVDLGQLLEDTVSLYRDIKPGVEIKSRTVGEIDEASCDREQMRSALVNLLDNAVAATDAPGEIEVVAARDNGLVRIQVADTGNGIPPGSKNKLFLPYYSTKQRGTGLGLAIVHRIVADHRGTIRVDENTPQGTVFTIEMPA